MRHIYYSFYQKKNKIQIQLNFQINFNYLYFVFFNNDENNYFKNKNHENIKEFNLEEYTHFFTNENFWNKTQLYKPDKKNEKKKEDNENYIKI